MNLKECVNEVECMDNDIDKILERIYTCERHKPDKMCGVPYSSTSITYNVDI